MKKVLALVLAVIMVCTMAFAASVTNTPVVAPTTNTPASSDGDTYSTIEPGKTLVVKFGSASINTKDGKFDADKNTVEVTFGKGAEWVASKGWVKVNNKTEGQTVVVGTNYYEYQITLKQDYTKAADANVCDLSISKITLRADGYDTQTIFAETKTVKCAYAVGYKAENLDVVFNADGDMTSPTALTDGTIYTIKSITDNGKAVNSVSAAKAYTIAGQKMTATMDLNVGQKILYVKNGVDFATTDKGYTGNNDVVGNSFNQFNTSVKVVLNQGENAAEKVYNVYAKDLSGKITKLAATLDRGVLTFKVPALSTFIVTTDSVTATATETPATPGTTTNPGTGANDIVGVAAALAVVALVSGAAISLKK